MASALDTITESSTQRLLKRLLRLYVWRHKKKLWIAAVCMVIAALATAANAYMLRPVMDEIFLKKNETLLYIIPAIILGISLAKGVSSYIQSMLMKIIGQRVVADMQIDMYHHMLHADIETFSDQSSGQMVSRFTNDIHLIRKNLTQVLTGLAKESLTLVFLIGVMIYQSWELALIALLVFPVAIYPVVRLGKNMRKVSHSTQLEMADYTARLDDTFQGVRIVKAYNKEDAEAEKANSVINRLYDLYVRAARIESASSPIMELLASVAIAAVVLYGGSQVLAGETTAGAFFSFMAALIMAYRPMKSISSLNNNLQEALAAVKRIFTVMDTEPRVKDAEDAEPLVVAKASIAFQDVSFTYGKGNVQALKNVSLNVPAGKRVALVGASGGGKSTIMHLVQRFYDPDEGVILISGQDIKQATLHSLRDHLAIVNQEATLFDDTVYENIAYGKQDATEEEIIQAAKSAAAHEFIMELPEGYHTMVGQHGLRLSGGQRQRIAIARAMLRNAPILLLDEATSALDNESEQKVQQALESLMRGRTTLVIAHRLSTIKDADCIYVIDKGEIVESGTHAELVKADGAYAALYQKSAGGQILPFEAAKGSV